MVSSGLQSKFHDAGLAGHRIGPRREITLKIQLDPVWNPGKSMVKVRFGGIENLEEVEQFLRAFLPESGDRLVTIGRLSCQGKPGALVCMLELWDGPKTKIACRNASEENA
jgi:hypothetical protein